ncbi:MAG: transglutaminase domain-containing protein [Bdellovibrio sp.]
MSTNLMASEETKLQKISISNTNNTLDVMAIPDWVFIPLEASDLKNLKTYVEKKGFHPSQNTEKEFVLSALSWVSSQWDHDGMNEPPKSFHALDVLKEVHNKKTRYRCVEYGLVLSEVLQAYGFVTRTLSLRSNNVSYGGFGQGHVAMEVWLNDIGKWIFLDPQFGVFLTAEKSQVPLNYFEIYQEKKAGRFDNLVVNANSASKNFIMKAENKLSYKNFLKNYFGHISLSDKSKNEVASLLLESKAIPLTFQGTPLNNALFTNRSELFYPEMNRVALFLSYKDNDTNFMELMKKLKIESDGDYLEKMALFAAKPDFNVTIKSQSKIKETYQFRESNMSAWKDVAGNSFEWITRNKTNRLEVRSVNEFGRPGPLTFLEVNYQ